MAGGALTLPRRGAGQGAHLAQDTLSPHGVLDLLMQHGGRDLMSEVHAQDLGEDLGEER